MKRKMLVLVCCMLLGACAEGGVKPEAGLSGGSSHEEVSPGVYRIKVVSTRFSTSSAADGMFKAEAAKVSEAMHCRGYRIISYSRYLKDAFPGAAIPVIIGEIECLR